jgi:hypothetical protein
VIETAGIAAGAKDGIQLIAVSRVTVGTNIDRLVGGAGEHAIVAGVSEGQPSPLPVRRALAKTRSLLRESEGGMRTAFVLKTILEPPRALERWSPTADSRG